MRSKVAAPTLRDVAKLADVSAQTVSLVVNGKAQISEETRTRVQRAIQQLGYIPHAAAQTLRSGYSGNIGLLVPDAHNPHFWGYVQGVEEVAVQHNYSVLLTISNLDPECERRAFRSLIEQRVDGLALILTFPELCGEELKALERRGKPFVGSTPDCGVDVVRTPYRALAEQMMAHLLGLGHRRIGLIHSVGRLEDAGERVAVHRLALTAAGVPWDDRLVVGCRPTFPETFAAANQLLDLHPRPTAIVGICDLAAFSAMQAAMQRGLRIPEDISIAGFDDIDMAALLTPGLTTARGYARECGRALAELLLQRIADPTLPPRFIEMPAELVIRGSTGPCSDASGASGPRDSIPAIAPRDCPSLAQ